MGIYGNFNIEKDYFKQYSLAIIDESSFNDILKILKTRTANHSNQISKININGNEYEELYNYIQTIKDAKENEYDKYKQAFNGLCKKAHIMSNGVVIVRYVLKKIKEDDFYFEVEYNYNTKKITLPKECKVYHISKVDNITKLIPQFKGKSERGYLYDKPRVYFTLFKNMPKEMADYSPNTKVTYYEALTPVRTVYMDPLVWGKLYGAIYVETTDPIPVKKVNGGVGGIIKDIVTNKQ